MAKIVKTRSRNFQTPDSDSYNVCKKTVTPGKPAKPKIKSEHTEQAVFMSQISFSHPTVLAFANPSGAKRSAWEAAQKKAEGLIAGIPDITIAEARGGWFGLYMEFKRSDQTRAINGGVSPEQVWIHHRLRGRGYKVVTVYSAAQAMQQFIAYMSLPTTVASIASYPMPYTMGTH